MGRRIRLLPIFVGTAIDIIGTLFASTLLAIVVAVLRGPDVFSEPPTGPILVAAMFLGCTFTVLGACVAGLMARQREVVHGLGVAVLGSVIGLWFDQGGSRWFPLVAVVAALLAGALGGWSARWARGGKPPVAVEPGPSSLETAQRRRRLGLTAGITVLVVVGLVLIGYFRPAAEQPAARLYVDRVYLVPIHAAPELIDRLKDYYQDQLGLEIEVLSDVQADSASYDDARQQLIAEELVATLRDRYGGLTQNGRAVVIGITSRDMYPRSRPWRFCFGWRSAPYAVVSYARMHLPATMSDSPDEARVFPRLRKMVTRYVGALAFHIGLNRDRRSIMYEDIMGLDDLDRIDEDLARAGFPVK
jgi:predicted Zn-dependent protease